MIDIGLVVESLPLLAKGTLMTIIVVAVSLVLGVCLGLLGGLARVSSLAPLRWLARTYVSVVRGTPFLVQLFFVYFGFPQVGIRVPAIVAAVGTLAVYSGSYQTEIVRGAIESIDKGQIEAARACGLSSLQTMAHVTLPQALLRMLAPLGNEFVALTKNSALVSLVAVNELFLTGQTIISRTFQNFTIFLTIGVIYYILTTIVGSITKITERKLRVYV